MEQIYPSKIDAWLGVVLIGACIAVGLAFFVAVKSGRPQMIIATLPAVVIGAGLPIWLMLSTRYTLNDTRLLVKSGPFSWEVPIKSITSVTETSNPLSSPALSLDRLRIEYSQGKAVMISPKQKREFLQDLEARRARQG